METVIAIFFNLIISVDFAILPINPNRDYVADTTESALPGIEKLEKKIIC